MAARSIHFRLGGQDPSAQPQLRQNPIEAIACLANDVGVLRHKLETLFSTNNRHGDLQVMASAAKRVHENLLILINTEEGV